ncbi:MAG TPA: hypothetical protein VG963_21430, partial [Polyangiaceae bacterium]|nr:hypothetical protein [Polyangiaceae bacterium]
IISADSSAQLEVRLQGFERALELRSGYILEVRRDAAPNGKLHATIAYELTLPEWLPAVRRDRTLSAQRRAHRGLRAQRGSERGWSASSGGLPHSDWTG